MMHDEQSMQNRMIAGESSEELYFGATRTIGDVLMGKILKKYMDQYPDARIRMIVENTRSSCGGWMKVP